MVTTHTIKRRRSHLSGVATLVGGFGVFLGAAAGLHASSVGLVSLLAAIGVAFLEVHHTSRYRGAISLPLAATGVMVLLWTTLAQPADPSYAFGGLLFVVFGLANLLGLSAVRRTFRELGEAAGWHFQ
ncbi:hypothetical protein [Haladaptatus sp.]|uniref:hypothetical protein n=1 Tax=Haladaptatus sp. TaxID=1973141 RepID=UPI003C4DCFED